MTALTLTLVCVASIGSGETVLLDFYGDSCPPCRRMAPAVQRLIDQGYPVRKVNTDRDQRLAQQFGVTTIPTFVMLVDGKEMTRVTGMTAYDRLEQMVRAGMARSTPPPAPSRTVPATPAVSEIAQLPARVASRAEPQRTSPSTRAGGKPRDEDLRAGPLSIAMAASVRIKIQDPDGHSWGSGTIIDSCDGEALILSCGHIFRDSDGKGRITVDLFGPRAPKGLTGTLVTYDLKRDLSLICVPTPHRLTTARMAPPSYRVRPGDPVVAIGCPGGSEPELLRSRINSIDKYMGPPNLQVAGAPVQGRSGGGLFTADGVVIGVCNAADPQDNEGLFAAAASIYGILDHSQLSFVYRPGSSPADVATTAPNRPEQNDIPQARLVAVTPPTGRTSSAAAAASGLQHLASNERPGLSDVFRQGQPAEVVCIVRPLSDPKAKSEVIVIPRASSEFLRQLTEEKLRQQVPVLTSMGTSSGERHSTKRPAHDWHPNWVQPAVHQPR